jgi:hypothetical protein
MSWNIFFFILVKHSKNRASQRKSYITMTKSKLKWWVTTRKFNFITIANVNILIKKLIIKIIMSWLIVYFLHNLSFKKSFIISLIYFSNKSLFLHTWMSSNYDYLFLFSLKLVWIEILLFFSFFFSFILSLLYKKKFTYEHLS